MGCHPRGQALIQRQCPMLMVEVSANQEAIWSFFKEAGYVLFPDNGPRHSKADQLNGNGLIPKQSGF